VQWRVRQYKDGTDGLKKKTYLFGKLSRAGQLKVSSYLHESRTSVASMQVFRQPHYIGHGFGFLFTRSGDGESFCTRRGDSSDASTVTLHLETFQACGLANAILWTPVKIHRGGPYDTVIGSASNFYRGSSLGGGGGCGTPFLYPYFLAIR
jgi:hypothetical protein